MYTLAQSTKTYAYIQTWLVALGSVSSTHPPFRFYFEDVEIYIVYHGHGLNWQRKGANKEGKGMSCIHTVYTSTYIQDREYRVNKNRQMQNAKRISLREQNTMSHMPLLLLVALQQFRGRFSSLVDYRFSMVDSSLASLQPLTKAGWEVYRA